MPDRPATVILIHGLYMNSLCMRPLGRWLRQAGYRVDYFVYPTLRRGPRDSALALLDFIQTRDAPEVHLVAHSLGGLVVRHLADRLAELPPGRVVTMGTPHQGSRVVKRLSTAGLRGLFGQSLEAGLLGNLPRWPVHRELGSLAGTQGIGIGRLLGMLSEASDGTITVAETELAGMHDHICVPRSHANMLFSPAVAGQVLSFLADGHFAPQTEPLDGIVAG